MCKLKLAVLDVVLQNVSACKKHMDYSMVTLLNLILLYILLKKKERKKLQFYIFLHLYRDIQGRSLDFESKHLCLSKSKHFFLKD